MDRNVKFVEVPYSSVVGKSLLVEKADTGEVVAQLAIIVPSPRYGYRETAELVATLIQDMQQALFQIERAYYEEGKSDGERAVKMRAIAEKVWGHD